MPQDPQIPNPRPRGRTRRFAARFGVVVLCLAALVAASAFWIRGKAFEGPAWLRAEVDTRLAEAIPNFDIDFGELRLVVENDWRPRVEVSNVDVRAMDGSEIIAVNAARVGFDRHALTRGELALTDLDLSGVYVSLRRTSEGPLELRATQGAEPVRRAASDMATMVSDIQGVLLQPGWRKLRMARVDGLTLNYEDARARRTWTVDGGRLRLQRDGTSLAVSMNLALLGGHAGVATLNANYAGQIGARAAQFGVTIDNLAAVDIATQSPAFSWMQAIDAPISGALRGGVSEDGVFEPLHASLQIGEGAIQPRPEATPVPIKGARSYFTYDPKEQVLQFNELSVESGIATGRLEGEARLSGEGGFDGLLGQFRLTDLMMNPGDLYPDAVRLGAAELDFRLSLSPFVLDVGRLDIKDVGGQLSLAGRARAGPDGWTISVDAGMDTLGPDRLIALWPQTLAPKARKWIDENIERGQIADVNAALRFGPGPDTPVVHVGFDFVKTDARFMRYMPLIRGAKGHASITDNRFVLIIDEGGVEALEGGFINLAGSSFIVPDVRAKNGTPGVVRLQTSSSTTAALSMLDQRPLEVMRKADLPVALTEGRALMVGTVALPMRKKVDLEEVSFFVDGELFDIETNKLVPDRQLASARLSLEATQDVVEISGNGTMDGVPFDIAWQQPLGPGRSERSTLTGTARISQSALDAFEIGLPDGTLDGQAEAQLDLMLEKGTPPRLSLRSDLQGLALQIPPLNWSKARQTSAQFALEADLGPVPSIDRMLLEAPGLRAEGTISLTDDNQLDRVRFNRVRVGNWLDAPVDLVGRGPGRSPEIVLRGGRLDLRTANPGGDSSSAEPSPLTVQLDQLQLTDDITLDSMTGSFTVGGGLRGRFAANLNGQAPISGEIVPQSGRTAIRAMAQDAGAVVAAVGALSQARGGAMELLLLPVGTGGAFDGKLRVNDVRIIEAPAIAALLNAISIVGLVNELNGDGIYFREVTADFRLSPGQVTVRQASAEGASMGLSMDGIYRTDTRAIQMQGVISPVYALNQIGSVFTRDGEGLFGFNYDIRGTTKDPQVSVYPLSALAPSGLRNIFRSPEPDVPLAEGETPLPPPPPPAKREREERSSGP
ncbi:MAG: AsmA-like C-terminal region-containing protein [Pseudomonadota bacterium]